MPTQTLQVSGTPIVDPRIDRHVERIERAGGLVTPTDIDRYVRRGHALRAEATQRAARGALDAVTGAARGALTAWRRHRAARETFRALASLDERQLRDIGVARADIPCLVESVRRGNTVHAPCLPLRHAHFENSAPSSEGTDTVRRAA